MEQINLYNDKKKQLILSLQQVSSIIKGINMQKEYLLCSDLSKKLSDDTFKVVVMGRFKVGKSTFINAILGSGDVLPAKATPCTAVINEVKYSKERYAVIYFKHPLPSPLPKLAPNLKKYIEGFQGRRVSPIKVDSKYLNQFVVIDDEAEDQKEGVAQTPFSKAEIYWDLPICEQGVEIIDTPGLDENMSRTDVTKNYLSQADAVIFVMDCTAPCALSEMQSIENDVVKAGHEYTIFVCNKINVVKEKERESIMLHMNKKLQSLTKLGTTGIFYVNAEEAKDSRMEKDQEKYVHSGMASFEAKLDEVLAKKRGSIKLLQPAQQIKTVIEYALTTVIPNERKILESSTQEINQRLQHELPNLERLKQEKELITAQIENEISKICCDAELVLQQRFIDIISNMPKWVNEVPCTNSVSWNPFKVKASVRLFSEELIENLQRELTSKQEQWQKSDLEPFITDRFQEMARKYQSTITRIFVDIERIKLRIAGADDSEVASNGERIMALVAGFFGGGVAGATVGGTLGFSKEFIATLTTQIALGVILGSIIGVTNPITLIAVIVAGLIGLGAGITKIEEKIRKKVSGQVVEQLRKERDNSIRQAVAIIRQNLKDGSAKLSNAIDNELKSVEDLVEQIRRDKQMGEQQVKERICKLEHNRTTIQGILTNIKLFIKNMEEKDIEFTPISDENPTHEAPPVSEVPRASEPLQNNVPEEPVQQPVPAPAPLPNPAPEPTPSKPEFVIAPGTEKFEKDGIVYYRLNNCHHAEDNCDGEMYIGDNGEYICGKCGSHTSVIRCKVEHTSDEVAILFKTDGSDNYWMEVSGNIALKAGLKWLNKFTENVIKEKEIQ